MKVSFCIPTYNRSKFIDELLSSINKQSDHSLNIEVCISDNASTDDTKECIEIWRRKYNFPIVYHRHSENIGPDRNYLAAVNMGGGDYCWILGSDDILSYNALALMEKKLADESDIYLCDRRELDLSMTKITNPHRKWLSEDSRLFSFRDDSDLIKYFSKCNSVGGLFSYLSSIIVRKDRWSSIKFDDSYIGTAYSHVYILLRIISDLNSTLQYISQPLVDCRGDNDTFESNGKARRIKIDFVGYLKLKKDFYSDNENLSTAFGHVLLKERPWVYTSLAMACYGNSVDRAELASYYEELGYHPWFTHFLFQFGKLANHARKIKAVKNIVKKILVV
ncbi:glycosyltransferase family 2 protein [Citrobacter werkmanii]|nr:glycosyltransferase family A protein [Citrobacter werkmanii]MBJ9597147.1 glycosyltransferase family 2 protein [Citrobacter werkmanii]MBJ9874070.1 glycosyltransferase family 2 protein [Citrobacter werkmanii]HEB0855344.1 glycosyltransferase family 2 protein [Citrobacter freundii]